MNSTELYNLLNLPDVVIEKLNTYGQKRKGSFHIALSDLMKDNDLVQNLDKIILENVGEDPDGFKTLWEELEIAKQSFEEYQKRGISIDIFADTMKFCTRFLHEHMKTHGCFRFVWGWWFPRQLSLNEFRIGSLEYEFCGEKFTNVHIPSDADLSKQSVSDSLSQYKSFCRQYYPEREEWELRCESWLLSPALKDVLNDNSNILAFQKFFHVTETDYESMAVLDWVFPGFSEVSEQLPEKTSLQKNMKKYLLEGKKIGWSKGILKKNGFQ